MNTYLIPREIGDENKFLIFSFKSLKFTAAFGVLGAAIHYFGFRNLALSTGMSELNVAGIIIAFVFAAIGYCLGTFSIPDIKISPFFKNASGEYLDDIIGRVIKFYKRRKIYIYTKGENM